MMWDKTRHNEVETVLNSAEQRLSLLKISLVFLYFLITFIEKKKIIEVLKTLKSAEWCRDNWFDL